MNTSKFASKKPKELDLRYANPEAQAYVREQAIRLHQEGWTNVDIAKHFNVHKNTVGKWLKRARSEGVENAVKGQKRGRMRILICVNGVLKHVNTPDSYLRERCANIGDSVRSLA